MGREQGESLISERLRRLREVEPELSMSPFTAMPKPAGHDRRERVMAPVVVEDERFSVGDDGKLEIVVREFIAMQDANASPLQEIVSRGWIVDRDEPEEMRNIRLTSALRYRSVFEGARVSPLKAQSYEGGGGGGGAPKVVNDYAIDCMKRVEMINREIPEPLRPYLVEVVCNDAWIWEGKKPAAVAADVSFVLRALDNLAVVFGYITPEEVAARWPEPLPRKPRQKPRAAAQDRQATN